MCCWWAALVARLTYGAGLFPESTGRLLAELVKNFCSQAVVLSPVLVLEDGQIGAELLDSRGRGLRLDVVDIPPHGETRRHKGSEPGRLALHARHQNLKRVRDLTELLSPETLFP